MLNRPHFFVKNILLLPLKWNGENVYHLFWVFVMLEHYRKLIFISFIFQKTVPSFGALLSKNNLTCRSFLIS